MNHVTLENCILNHTTLAFEKCSNINATIDSKITSVKNPISGVIKAKEIDTLIIDPNKVDPEDTEIISEEIIDNKLSIFHQNQEDE